MKNYFIATEESPFHLSIGAVLINKSNQVCCHYFKKYDAYILMRESIEAGELIEETLHRGLMEEFGAEAEINRFLGSETTRFFRNETPVQKTTLYFLCTVINQDEDKRKSDDFERESELKWLDIDFAISKMKGQNQRLMREEADESEILERAKKFILKNE